MRAIAFAAATAALFVTACKTGEPSVRAEAAPARAEWSLDSAPADVQPAIQKASAAMASLQGTLLQKLVPAMETGGPRSAIDVCATEAQAMTQQIVDQQGIALGRTSHKLRNPKNAAPGWAAEYVQRHAGARAADVPPRAFDLGDKVGVLRPIPTGAMCASCHGTDVKDDVSATLAQHYPEDQARGFSEGDLRGFFWAEVPRRPAE